MELLILVVVVAAIITAYFCIGFVVRFVWEWWVLIAATPTMIVVGAAFGWTGAVLGIIGWLVSLGANNAWHSSSLYLAGAGRLDKSFFFSDT